MSKRWEVRSLTACGYGARSRATKVGDKVFDEVDSIRTLTGYGKGKGSMK